jgi:hypothetical protein
MRNFIIVLGSYFTKLSVPTVDYVELNGRMIVNDKLGRIWKKAVVAYLRYPGICPGAWREPQKLSEQPVCWNSNQAPPEYNFRALLQRKAARLYNMYLPLRCKGYYTLLQVVRMWQMTNTYTIFVGKSEKKVLLYTLKCTLDIILKCILERDAVSGLYPAVSGVGPLAGSYIFVTVLQ